MPKCVEASRKPEYPSVVVCIVKIQLGLSCDIN
jgi:hypothetical protein